MPLREGRDVSLGEDLRDANDSPPPEKGRFHCDETPDGVEIETPYIAGDDKRAAARSGDWSWLLAEFDLDPATFEVDGNSVRISKWQQSKRLDSGDRDLVWLYSYRARFRRLTRPHLAEVDVAELRDQVAKWRTNRRTPGAGLGPPATQLVEMADFQLGKAGTREFTVPRVEASLAAVVQQVKDLRRVGRNIGAISLWNMGDIVEAVAGHYASQPATTELNERDQYNLATDLTLAFIRELAPLVDDFEFGACLCNHGENRSADGKKISDDSDNASAYLADAARTVLDGRPGFDHIRWAIPRDEMVMTTTMSGVPVAMTHGHTAPAGAKELEWLRAQSLRLWDLHKVQPRIWFTAHRHHLNVTDFGPFTRIQAPSADVGSKWWTDATGLYSAPGLLTCLVGEHDAAGGRGWSDLAVL